MSASTYLFLKHLEKTIIYQDALRIVESESDGNLLDILNGMKESGMLDYYLGAFLPIAYPIAVKKEWRESTKYLEENGEKFETSFGKPELFVNVFILDMYPKEIIPEKWLVSEDNNNVFKILLSSENIPQIQKYIDEYGVPKLDKTKVSLEVLKVIASYYSNPLIFVSIEDSFRNDPDLEVSKIEWLLKTRIITTKEFVQEVLTTSARPIDQKIIMPFFELFKNTNLLKKIFDQGIEDIFICERFSRSVMWANHKMGNTHKEILIHHRDKSFDEMRDFILDYKKYVKEQK